MSDSFRPCGLWQPQAPLSIEFSSRNSRVGCHSLLQGAKFLGIAKNSSLSDGFVEALSSCPGRQRYATSGTIHCYFVATKISCRIKGNTISMEDDMFKCSLGDNILFCCTLGIFSSNGYFLSTNCDFFL